MTAQNRRCITVGKPQGSVSNGFFTLSAQLDGEVSGTCFYSIPEQYRNWVDEESSNCFMIGLLYTAMFAGCDLHIEGKISEKLLFHTREYLIPMLHGFFNGSLSKISVSAAETTTACYPDADIIGTGFSGGIDSFHTIIRRGVDPQVPASHRINMLFFFNVGSHGMGEGDAKMKQLEEKFITRYHSLCGYPKEIGMPYIMVNSNIHQFHQSGHLQTSTLGTLSAALFMGRKMKLYYFASAGFDYRTLFYNDDPQGYDIEIIDDSTLPHVCTETMAAIADGADASRPVKTEFVAAYEPAERYLNVCGNQEVIDENCSICYKCKRTMMTLDILDLLDRFDKVFDLKKYTLQERSRFAAEILNGRKKDLFLRDLYHFAVMHDYDLRSKTTLFTRIYMALSNTKFCAKLRAMKKRFS